MNISFKLEPVPNWMPMDNRFCRACDQKTEWVLVAVKLPYTYPCCDNELCQEKVRDQITKAAETKASA